MPDNVETTETTENSDEKSEIKGPELLAMSDEEFMKMNGPASSSSKEKEEEPEKEPEKEEKTDAESTDLGAVSDGDGDKKTEEPAKDKPAQGDGQDGKEPDKVAGKNGKTEEEKPSTSGSEPKDKAKTETKTAKSEEEKPVNYENFYKQVMTPFKANGKTIEVKTPEEAVRLMQMGAGFGKKIQAMQPHLKVLRMLEKNNLLDENRLTFLIDLSQKNPDAIKKLIKDGGIDPLDLNTDDKVAYKPGNHVVTDKEVVFHETLKEVQAQPGGHETLQIINQTWDQESKGLLWDSPEIFTVIQTQRENGVYDQIVAEIDRQKTLGTISYATPFLQAYKTAGDHLVKTNGFKQIQNQPGTTTQPPQVIATRTAAPKNQAPNSDKAAAASPTKTSTVPKTASTVNPLAMSDDDFMKQYASR